MMFLFAANIEPKSKHFTQKNTSFSVPEMCPDDRDQRFDANML